MHPSDDSSAGRGILAGKDRCLSNRTFFECSEHTKSTREMRRKDFYMLLVLPVLTLGYLYFAPRGAHIGSGQEVGLSRQSVAERQVRILHSCKLDYADSPRAITLPFRSFIDLRLASPWGV